MIIQYPTALYKTVLPHKPSDSGNVTWTISGPPPFLTQEFSQLPSALENMSYDPSAITMTQRRSAMGPLLYSTTSTNRTALGSNSRQFITGSLIDFVDTLPVPDQSILPLPSQITDIQHGLAHLNYVALGLNTDQQLEIVTASNALYSQLQFQVAQARESYLALQVTINEDQKLINETVAAISALKVLSSNSAIAEMITILQTTKSDAQTRIDANVAAANQQTITLNDLIDQLSDLAQIVE